MHSTTHRTSATTAVPPPPRPVGSALWQLWQAYRRARAARRSAEEFAVPVGDLQAGGLTEADLRWLIWMGYAEHFVGTPPTGDSGRAAHQDDNLPLTEGSRFALSAEGARFVGQLRLPPEEVVSTGTSAEGDSAAPD